MITCVLDGREIQDRDKLHDVLSASLSFPEWYGRNLDALYDCLTDMQEEVEIRFLWEDILREHLGGYAEALIKAVCVSAEENSRIRLVFA